MRILIVSEDLPAPQPGGLAKHAVTLSNALMDLGHEVQFMGRGDRGDAASVQDTGLRAPFIPALDLANIGWKETQLGVWWPAKRPHFAKRMAKAIMEHASGFDVIHYHGHFPMLGRYLPAHVNFVQTRHDQGSECITHLRFVDGRPCAAFDDQSCARCAHSTPGPLRRAISSRAVARYRAEAADTFRTRKTIFVSDFLRRRFMAVRPEADMTRTRVIHNFIDFDRLQRAAQGQHEVRPRSLVLVGRIDAAKGFGAFLDALVAADVDPDVSVTVIGDGPDRASLEARFAARPQFRFMGWLGNEDVLRETLRAHAVVVPSAWEEPFGTTVLEALLLGRPCLALRRGGIPEVGMYERFPGQLQLSGEMDELARAALRCLDQPSAVLPPPSYSSADVKHQVEQIVSFYMAD